MARSWKLSPSDFAFGWEECHRCFYLKTVSGFYRPRGIMPKIFGTIDGAMKNFYMGKRTETIAPGLPPGIVAFGEKWVESKPIAVPGFKSTCFVKGKFDTVLQFDDGSYAVVDFKTSSTKSDHIHLYSRQLHAYAYALENAAPGGFAAAPVKKLGLIVFEPATMAAANAPNLALTGPIAWVEIQRVDAAFVEFLSEVMAVLDLPLPPTGSPSCEWCNYRDVSRRTGL